MTAPARPHAYLPPSGANAWSKCALWATMNARYPQGSTSESEEGDAAHWVATEMLAGRSWPEGTVTPNNQIVTEEMVDGAYLYCETVLTRALGRTLHIEERVEIPEIHASCFGTPDTWARSGHTKVIDIFDYKYGHRFVDEFWNPQGLCYLAGIIRQEYGQTTDVPTDIQVNFTVVQPRCYYKGSPVRTHSFKLKEANPYFYALKLAANASVEPNPVATTNDACIYCPGRHSCSALQKAAYSDAECSTDRLPLELTPEAAGLELRLLTRALDRLEARVDGLKQITEANLKNGKRVPFWHIESGFGRMNWNKPPAEILALGNMLGVSLVKPAVITPTQAKKLIDESVINAYSDRASTLKLVQDNPADLRKVFGTNPVS